MARRFLKFLGDNFFAGLIIVSPAIITFVILRFIIIKLNNILLNPILRYLTPYFAAELHRVVLAKILIFIVFIFVMVLIGLATRILVVKRAFLSFERILYRLPMVNKIYKTTREISDAFLGKRKDVFKKVVLIEYPRKGIYSIGFVTSDTNVEPSRKAGKDLIGVYVPTIPNPTSGVFLLIPRDEIMPLDMSVEDGLKTVISAGLIHSSSDKSLMAES